MEEQKEERLDFEELLRRDRAYQSACDKKVSQALSTARANWERERQAEEATRRSELERELERRLGEERAELSRQQQDFQHRMRQVAVAEALQQRGLDAAFAPWLTGETEEESAARVDQFTQLFQSALSHTVAGRMRGSDAPRARNKPQSLTRESLRGMSTREINGNWAEISDLLKG